MTATPSYLDALGDTLLRESSRSIFAVLDRGRTLTDCSRGFMRLAGCGSRPVGQPLAAYLDADSAARVESADSTGYRGSPVKLRLRFCSPSAGSHLIDALWSAHADGFTLYGEPPLAVESDMLLELARLNEALITRNREIVRQKAELEKAKNHIRKIEGLLPICSYCKQIRDDRGAWSAIETYIRARHPVSFSHGICPACARAHFPELNLYDGSDTQR
jgi:hypothetical protein